MGQYWREAGMTFLRYSNICAEHVRRATKVDPAAQARGGVKAWEMIKAKWEGGKIVSREVLSPKK